MFRLNQEVEWKIELVFGREFFLLLFICKVKIIAQSFAF